MRTVGPPVPGAAYPPGRGEDPPATSWSGLEPMPAVRPPRVLTRADVPRRRDRVRLVCTGRWDDRSAGETAVQLLTVALVATAGPLLWRTGDGVGRRAVEWLVAVSAVVAVSTVIQVRLRFRS